MVSLQEHVGINRRVGHEQEGRRRRVDVVFRFTSFGGKQLDAVYVVSLGSLIVLSRMCVSALGAENRLDRAYDDLIGTDERHPAYAAFSLPPH